MNGMTFEFDTPHGRMMATMLGNDHHDRQPSHCRDWEVVVPSAATLHEFGDERGVRKRIEGEIEALKLGGGCQRRPGNKARGGAMMRSLCGSRI